MRSKKQCKPLPKIRLLEKHVLWIALSDMACFLQEMEADISSSQHKPFPGNLLKLEKLSSADGSDERECNIHGLDCRL